jgi:hypothetical protein
LPFQQAHEATLKIRQLIRFRIAPKSILKNLKGNARVGCVTISVPVGVDTRNGVRISKGLDKTELIDLVLVSVPSTSKMARFI